MPKGMSPVLIQHKEVDRALSQHAKNTLHSLILEGYENELMSVKWRHCRHNGNDLGKPNPSEHSNLNLIQTSERSLRKSTGKSAGSTKSASHAFPVRRPREAE